MSLVSGSLVRTRTGAWDADAGVVMPLGARAWLQRLHLDISRTMGDLCTLREHAGPLLVSEGGRGGCKGERSGEEVRAVTDLEPFSGIFVSMLR